MLSGVAFGMLLLSSPLAIVTYFVLPTVFTIVVNLVSALDWVRDWLDLGTTTTPMFDGDPGRAGLAAAGHLGAPVDRAADGRGLAADPPGRDRLSWPL